MTFFVRTLVLISLMAVLLPNMTNAAPVNHKRHNHEPWSISCSVSQNTNFNQPKLTPAMRRNSYLVSYFKNKLKKQQKIN